MEIDILELIGEPDWDAELDMLETFRGSDVLGVGGGEAGVYDCLVEHIVGRNIVR